MYGQFFSRVSVGAQHSANNFRKKDGHLFPAGPDTEASDYTDILLRISQSRE